VEAIVLRYGITLAMLAFFKNLFHSCPFQGGLSNIWDVAISSARLSINRWGYNPY